MNQEILSFLSDLANEVDSYLIIDQDIAYYRDPIFGIVRNRVNAEICKTFIRLERTDNVGKLVNYLVSNQNRDGSWNEKHPKYDNPSALITSIIGEALIDAYRHFPHDAALRRARDYVLSQEREPGYFLKSKEYTADHLNVDATCGAFLASYGCMFDDSECLESAWRAVKHIIDNQTPEGFYPYTITPGNYPYAYNVPDIHYQAVTLYFLSKIYAGIPEPWIKKSLIEGGYWLKSVQQNDGTFDWSKSGLMFAYHLCGAYGFAYAVFSFLSRWDASFKKNTSKSIHHLKKNRSGIMLRWDHDPWWNLPPSLWDTFQVTFIGDFPIRERIARLGYGLYREVARRRFSNTPDVQFFNLFTKVFAINVSTVEPAQNYQDLFMTAEVMDCISYNLESRKWEISHG